MDLGTYANVDVDDNDENFRMLCVTAETNTVTIKIVRISLFRLSAMNFLYTCYFTLATRAALLLGCF